MGTRRHRIAAAACLLLLVLGSPIAPPAAADLPALPGEGALFGAYVGLPSGTSRQAGWTSFEAMVGRTMALDREYYQWDQTWPTPDDAWSRDQGRVLFISWNAKAGGTWTPWARIADGTYDGIVDARAADLAAFGDPVIFSFHHEPEGDAGAGTSADYVAAFRHIRERFQLAGVNDVLYAWTLSASSFGTTKADAFYPGDEAVDIVAADGYNWFACPNKPGSPWRSFGDIFAAFHAFGAAHGKPMIVAEFGAHEDPAVPTRKAQWIAEAATQLESWPDVKGAIYYHQDKGCPRWVDSSPASLDAFRGVAADPYFSPPPTLRVTSGPPVFTTSGDTSFTFTSSVAAGFRCRLDGGTTRACDGGSVSYTIGGVPHRFEVWGVDGSGTAVTGTARWAWTVDLPGDVLAADFSFSPATRFVNPGVAQQFSFVGPSSHTVTDSSAMKLFDSGPMGYGAAYALPLPGAGTYAYACTITPSMTGKVKVGVLASPLTGTTTTNFTITWASGAPPSGFAYDVQYKRPGSSKWKSFRNDTLDPNATFLPASGAGTYSFRGRLQRLGSSATSGWSGERTIQVT
jgi:plastocyanin